jgi:hypothetical protein
VSALFQSGSGNIVGGGGPAILHSEDRSIDTDDSGINQPQQQQLRHVAGPPLSAESSYINRQLYWDAVTATSAAAASKNAGMRLDSSQSASFIALHEFEPAAAQSTNRGPGEASAVAAMLRQQHQQRMTTTTNTSSNDMKHQTPHLSFHKQFTVEETLGVVANEVPREQLRLYSAGTTGTDGHRHHVSTRPRADHHDGHGDEDGHDDDDDDDDEVAPYSHSMHLNMQRHHEMELKIQQRQQSQQQQRQQSTRPLTAPPTAFMLLATHRGASQQQQQQEAAAANATLGKEPRHYMTVMRQSYSKSAHQRVVSSSASNRLRTSTSAHQQRDFSEDGGGIFIDASLDARRRHYYETDGGLDGAGARSGGGDHEMYANDKDNGNSVVGSPGSVLRRRRSRSRSRWSRSGGISVAGDTGMGPASSSEVRSTQWELSTKRSNTNSRRQQPQQQQPHRTNSAAAPVAALAAAAATVGTAVSSMHVGEYGQQDTGDVDLTGDATTYAQVDTTASDFDVLGQRGLVVSRL